MSARLPARVITVAWGKRYVDRFLSTTVPAILAPGNLPALAEHFSCTFTLVTEEAFFDHVSRSPAWRRLGDICTTRLLPIDDLVAGRVHYGLSLSFAFFRGFEDLGPGMVDVHLLFLNGDFVLADGSYRSLAVRMLAGERLIHAPSYCVIEQEVEQELGRRIYPESGILAIPPRDMARIVLRHRHYTIRAKTVNQRLFRMHRFDQFYWQVDDHTLLCRQLPISLVCMKPERVITELRTFWDYGIVSEFCPTAKPCVLGDSDDFLMIELRDASTFRDLFRLGWPSVSEIAKDLSGYTTKDHRDSGRFTLALHDEDLPVTLNGAKKQFDAFIAQIYRKLSAEPVSYLNHHFWSAVYPIFQRMRLEYLKSKAENGAPPSAIASAASTATQSSGPCTAAKKTFFSSVVQWISEYIFGQIPDVKLTHPYHSILRPAFDAVKMELATPGRRVLLIASQTGLLSTFVQSYSGRGHSVTDGHKVLSPQSPLFGHRRETMTAGVELDGCDGKPPFDLCVCELDLTHLLDFKDIFQRIRPLIAPNGRIVVFHFNMMMRDLRSFETKIIHQSTLPIGRSQVIFTGSVWTQVALSLYEVGSILRVGRGRWRTLAYAALVLCTMPFSVIGNLVSKRQTCHVLPDVCLSLTMDYRLF